MLDVSAMMYYLLSRERGTFRMVGMKEKARKARTRSFVLLILFLIYCVGFWFGHKQIV